MQNPAIIVSLFPNMGRGVLAINSVKSGTFLTQCELLVLSQDDTKTLYQTELKHYTFKYNSTRDCLVLGIGEIFNHSDTPNVEYYLANYTQDSETREVMIFSALRDIKPGEQLFIDYNADVPVNVQEYLDSESLQGKV